MALPLFSQGAFQVDANATPDQIAQKRAYIAAMMPRFGSAKFVGEGLGQLATGVVVGKQNRKLNEAEGAGRKSAADWIARWFGTANSAQSPDVQGPLSVLGMGPEIAPVDPSNPEAIASDAMTALGKGATAEGIKAGLVARGMPEHIADGFVMNFQDESGLNPGINEIAPIVPGSRGGFGLAQWTGPRRKALEAFAAERGMPVSDPGVQMDFLMTELQGPEAAAWAKISGAQNAGEAGAAIVNSFLRPAEEHRRAREAEYLGGTAPSGSAAPAPTSAPSIPINELYMALQNPWMSAEEKGLITSMIQEQQAASDPLRQLELRKAEIELAQLENPTQQPPEDFTARMFTLNSLGIDPQSEEGKVYLMTGKLPEPPEPGYRAVTPEEAAARLPKGADPSEYQVSPEGKIEKIGGGGTNVTVNNGGMGVEPLGTEGQVLVPDPTQPSGYRVEVAPGSKMDKERKAEAAAKERKEAAKSTEADVIINAAKRARESAAARDFGAAGTGLVASLAPWSDSGETVRQVATLKANGTFSALQQMRDNSPTGAALGAASDRDLQLLADKAGALDPNSPNFVRDLDDYERTLLRTLYGPEEGDRVFNESRQGASPAATGGKRTLKYNPATDSFE